MNAFDRKDFLPSEIEAIRRAMEPAERDAARDRMIEGAKVGKLSTPCAAAKTRDKIGSFAGVSGRTVEKIAAGRLSALFADPFLRRAFRRAERGGAAFPVPADHPKPPRGDGAVEPPQPVLEAAHG